MFLFSVTDESFTVQVVRRLHCGWENEKIPEKYSMRQIERLPHLPDPGFDTLSFVSRFTTLLVIPVPWIRGHAYARLVG